MLKRLSGRPAASFCAALFYTVLSPSALLVRAVASDMGNPLRPRRLHTLIAYGDGPHLAALALVPFAIYMLDRALERCTSFRCAGAILAIGAVALTNWLGAFALAALIFCYLISGRPWRDWLTTTAIGLAAYILVSPLLTPSLIRTIQFNAQTIGGDFRDSPKVLLHYAPYILATFALTKTILLRLRCAAYLQMLILFTALMAWCALGFSWFNIAIVPQPDRYLLELDLGLTLSLAMSLALLPLRATRILVIVLALFSAAQAYRGQRYARGLIYPINIATTVEYRIADWFDRNLRGARVMVPGTISFFLQDFTDTPQLGGGFENGVVNYQGRIAQFEITSGAGTTALNDVPLSVLWMKAFGIQAVAAGGKQTREFYHHFANGAKFAGILPELFRDGDDAIYRVPLRTPSLAHVMARSQLVVNPPINGIDVGELRRYVEAIDDPALPEAQFVWKTQHSAEILADLTQGQVAQIQITYHKGWRASVNGISAPIIPDGLGFFAVAPDCTGRCRIELVYDGGDEQRIARAASGLLFLCWLGWAAANTWRRKARSTESLATPPASSNN